MRNPPFQQTKIALCFGFSLAAATAARGERINQEGRILGPEVPVITPVLFNTPQADAVLSAMQIMPLDSAWNEDVSRRPLLGNSAAMIDRIRADLLPGRRTLRAFHEMNYVLVPDAQTLVPITFVDYGDESDPSPYPISGNMPVETWPRETGALTLAQWQQDVNNSGGDRHAIVAMPGAGFVWETWQARLVGGRWQASNGAKFNLRSNALRPAGWTSADAAGLPMFPALVRYDECLRGMVEHAMRIVVRRTRREYIYPATHFASSTPASSVDVPAMGQRVRLKAGFAIPAHWTIFEKAVCLGLKKYGALVADNGNFFSISVTPDDRYPAGAFDHLSTIDIDNFEVVLTTGPAEGTRSSGAPSVNAGADLTVASSGVATLPGSATGTGITIEWTKYSGPGAVTFGNAAQATTTARFSLPGTYVLRMSAQNHVHAPAFDAVSVTVTDVPVTGDGGAARLRNLSTRSLVGSGGEVQIGGFTIDGSAAKKVIIRAAGPSLAQFGVPGALADPVLFVYAGQTLLAQNDDWDASLAVEFAQAAAGAWTSGSRDAAVVLMLPPGGYTAHVRGKNNTGGVALVEVFDTDGALHPGKLSNLSTRSFVGVGSDVQIGGFVVTGPGAQRVVVRAAGPALAQFGVAGVLADPILVVYAGATAIAQNDDWEAALAADFARVGAGSWTTGSKDAALVLTLQPGVYTAHVSGRNGTTGVALFEVFRDNG